MTLKELREKKAKLAAEIVRQRDVLNAEDHAETAEESRAWEEVNSDYNDVQKKIEREERAASVAAEISDRNEASREQRAGREDAVGGAPSDPEAQERKVDLAFRGWLAYQGGQPVRPEWREAADEIGMQFHVKEIHTELRRDGDYLPRAKNEQDIRQIANARENRANQSALVGALGGHLVAPPTMANALEVAMLYYGGMMEVAEVIRTDTGVEFQWPGYNDTGNSGRQINENAAVSVTEFVPSKDTWGAYKFTSDEVKVPYELLEDSAFDIPTIVGTLLGERIGRILNTKFTTGNGANTPYGIVTASATGVTSDSATAFTADELIDLVYSVDKAYRDGGQFMLSDEAEQYIRKLKDGEGNYLWSSGMGLSGTSPDRILGYSYAINNDMAAFSSNAPVSGSKHVIFGQLSKYKIRMVRGMRSYRLVERHRENDQDAFVSFVRADGGLLNSGGNPVKALLQS